MDAPLQHTHTHTHTHTHSFLIKDVFLRKVSVWWRRSLIVGINKSLLGVQQVFHELLHCWGQAGRKHGSIMTRGKHTHTKRWVGAKLSITCFAATLESVHQLTSSSQHSNDPTAAGLTLCHCVKSRLSVWERFSSQPQRTSQLVTLSALCALTREKLRYHLTSGPQTERSLHRWVKAETSGWLSIRGLRETRLPIN